MKNTKISLLVFSLVSLLILTNCSTPPPPPPPAAPKAVEAPKNPYEALAKKIERLQDDAKITALKVLVQERNETKLDFFKSTAPEAPPALEAPAKVEKKARTKTENEVDAAAGSEKKAVAKPKSKDQFFLGSSSKALTAVLIGQLIDQKLISWDTTLRELLPKNIYVPPQHKNTTVEMILAHRAGFVEPQNILGKKAYDNLAKMKTSEARQKIFNAILNTPPKFTPGSQFELGHSGYLVLGVFLELQSHYIWEELVQNKVLADLSMQTCVADNDPAVPKAMTPSIGLTCRAEDWVKFLTTMSQGFYKESTFLKEDTFEKLMTVANPDKPFTYGNFVRFNRSWAAGAALAITGETESSYNISAFAPAREIVISIFMDTHTKDSEHTATKIMQMITDANPAK